MDDELREFVRARNQHLLRRAYLLTGSRSAAEDLVQEALARCCVAWRRRRVENPDAYVLQVMINLQTKRWRRRRFVDQLSDRVIEESVPDGATERAEQDRMWQLLLDAPPGQRAVLVLRYYEGLPEAEIASALGIAIGTVRSQNARGLARLRTVLEGPAVVGEAR